MSHADVTQNDIIRLENRIDDLETHIDERIDELRLDFRHELEVTLSRYATKDDIRRLEGLIGDTAAATVRTLQEYFTDLFRAADDQTKAVGDRVTVLERRVDEHVGDASVHRASRKRRARR